MIGLYKEQCFFAHFVNMFTVSLRSTMREKCGLQLLSSLCRLNNQIPTISKLPAVSLQFSRFESEYVSREKRIAAKAKYKPYTWEERNQFYYPKIERRSEQLNEILHRDTPLNPDGKRCSNTKSKYCNGNR